MAQSSYPQAGLFPVDGPDCGSYMANEWRALLLSFMRAGGMVNTGAIAPPGLPATPMYPNVGVFYVIPDRLAVTSTGNNKVSIATGAWLCDGTFGYNDTAITDAAIVSPAANPRIDRVVVRQNYSGADYTSVNVPSLIVIDNTARLCIISGAENAVPVAPTLTQDQNRLTYWDIPLYQYQISVAGAISNITDEREWVDAETKYRFVPCVGGFNGTDGIPLWSIETYGGFRLLDNKSCRASGQWIVSEDVLIMTKVDAVIRPNASGNVYSKNIAAYSDCGEIANIHSDSNPGAGYAAIAVTLSERECIQPLTLPGYAVTDMISLEYYRDAIDALDTINADVILYGWRIEYLGWGRK